MNPLHRMVIMLIVCVPIAVSLSAQTTPAALPSDEEIRAYLADRIDVQHKSVGMVVGILTPSGQHVISYGKDDQEDPRPLGGDTVFEIGSITKIFTALLLADMVHRGEVALTDPVARYLPAGLKVPERNGRSITMADLATQTSGLPFLPSDIPLDDLAKATEVVAKYDLAHLCSFLSGYELTRDIGSKWEYSNTGFSLLGLALANRAGMDYETLVRARITGPLRMKNTAVTMTGEMKSRRAVGHDGDLRPAPEVNMPAFVPASSLKSTANDLLTFLAAFTGRRKSPLAPAMRSMLNTRRPGPGFQQALGWWVVPLTPGDEGIVFHGGQTPGFSSAIAYDPKSGRGVVVLSNDTQDDGGLSWHLLRPNFPLTTSAAASARKEKTRNEIVVSPELLDRLVGQYRASDGGVMDVVRENNRLVLKSATAPTGGSFSTPKARPPSSSRLLIFR